MNKEQMPIAERPAPILANTLLVTGHLSLHEHFQIRKNGKWYTVHAQVKQYMNDNDTNLGRGDFFTIAVNRGKMYAFDFYQKVVWPCR